MTTLEIPDGKLLHFPSCFDTETSSRYLTLLLRTIVWEQKTIKIYGRQVASPRLTAWYGDHGATYSYSGIFLEPRPWIPVLQAIKAEIETICCRRFNSVLANQYRGGDDSMGWHSDDERNLGPKPTIASVSFGVARRFVMRHKSRPDIDPLEFPLGDGDLLVMCGTTQEFWKHQVPKTRVDVGVRVNLTFRWIVRTKAT